MCGWVYTTQSVRTVSDTRRLNASGSSSDASLPGKRSRPAAKAVRRPAKNLPRNTRLRTRTGKKKLGRELTRRVRKNDVEVGDLEQVGCLGLQPSCRGGGLALGAMAIAAGVVGDLLIPALRALQNVPT